MGDEEAAAIAFIRIYASPEGASHFGEVTVDTNPCELRAGPSGRRQGLAGARHRPDPPQDGPGLRQRLASGPRRQFVLVSAGEVELTVSDGETRRFGPARVFLADDTTGKGHRTRVVGSGGCIVVWVACE